MKLIDLVRTSAVDSVCLGNIARSLDELEGVEEEYDKTRSFSLGSKLVDFGLGFTAAMGLVLGMYKYARGENDTLFEPSLIFPASMMARFTLGMLANKALSYNGLDQDDKN